MPFSRRQIAAFVLASSMVAQACQVPVFRYALERWEVEDYQLTITPGKDGLSKTEQAALEFLRIRSRESTAKLNLSIQMEAPDAAIPHARMQLNYPGRMRGTAGKPVWQTALTLENSRHLADSPVRAELGKRLLAGESAVWLLLECGDAAKDEAAARTLAEGIVRAQEKLKLPEGVLTQDQAVQTPGQRKQESADVLWTDLPLKLHFSVLRLKRSEAAETALIQTLMHVEDDLGEYTHEPMTFPVFGRGRVLEPLIGAGVTVDNIMEQSGYLSGACSCEIKDQNPGVDLLLAADWSPVDKAPKVETVRIDPKSAPVPPPATDDRAVPLVGATLVLIVAAWMLWQRRK